MAITNTEARFLLAPEATPTGGLFFLAPNLATAWIGVVAGKNPSPLPLSRKGRGRSTQCGRGPQPMGGSLRPPCLQSLNTEFTEMLRALRVEGLMVAEYTEPLPGDGMLIRS